MGIARPEVFSIGNGKLTLPEYFPSVSSVKTSLRPLEYIKILAALEPIAANFLVSAFDLARLTCEERKEASALLNRVTKAERVVLMDSGNYEGYWSGAETSWRHSDFFESLRHFTCTAAFGFDERRQLREVNEHARLILTRQREDIASGNGVPIIPVIHGEFGTLPDLCKSVAECLDVNILAIPERRLGEGIFQRVKTIASIRQALDETGRYVALHLLGTGNPLSLALFSIVGADSFDGLEWCQTVVDHGTGALSHLSHADFYSAQTEWVDADVPPQLRVLAHNLTFYANWMKRLRVSIRNDEASEFCRLNFPARIYSSCTSALGWRSR